MLEAEDETLAGDRRTAREIQVDRGMGQGEPTPPSTITAANVRSDLATSGVAPSAAPTVNAAARMALAQPSRSASRPHER